MTSTDAIPRLSSLNLKSLGQRIARLDHFFQARMRNRFGKTVKLLTPHIPRGSVILDIGANHGKFTKNFAKLHGGSCRVHAFEPLEYNYTLLATITNKYTNVTIHRIALSDTAGETEFFVPVRSSGRISPGSGHLGIKSGVDHAGTGTAKKVCRETVQTDTLDALMEREKFNRLDFIKMDVQGAEPLILRGGLASIRTHTPAIYTEVCRGLPAYNGLTVQDTINPLLELGYEMFIVDEEAGMIEPCPEFRPECINYLFLHPRKK